MATSADRMNLVDVAKSTDHTGKAAIVAEILNETNPMCQDAPCYPSNAPLGNRVTLRSSLPTTQFTKVNKGTPKSKGSTEQRVDSIGIIDGRSEVDVKLKIGLGEAQFLQKRMDEDSAFMESIAQTWAQNMLYGDEAANEAAFTGFQLRMNTLSTALSQSKVVGCAGSGGDNTSMYVIDWHERYCHLIYPEGTTGGIETRPLGEQPVNDKDGNPFNAFVTAYLLATGITVKDRRHIGRLCNIDVSDTAGAGGASYTGPDLLNKLIDLLALMPQTNGAERVIYCHQTIWAAFHKLALAKSNAALSIADYMGRGLIPMAYGFPIRRSDRISLAETVVT